MPLAPCAQVGKTRPCATALIMAGVARVVAAIEDSDVRVSGKGFAMLRAAGIAVTTGVLAQSAAQDHAGFFLKTGLGRAWVTLKLSNSVDGRIATALSLIPILEPTRLRRIPYCVFCLKKKRKQKNNKITDICYLNQ